MIEKSETEQAVDSELRADDAITRSEEGLRVWRINVGGVTADDQSDGSR